VYRLINSYGFVKPGHSCDKYIHRELSVLTSQTQLPSRCSGNDPEIFTGVQAFESLKYFFVAFQSFMIIWVAFQTFAEKNILVLYIYLF